MQGDGGVGDRDAGLEGEGEEYESSVEIAMSVGIISDVWNTSRQEGVGLLPGWVLVLRGYPDIHVG